MVTEVQTFADLEKIFPEIIRLKNILKTTKF